MTLPELQSLAQLLTGSMLNSAAAGILLTGLVWAALRLIRRQNSGTRFAVWLLALVTGAYTVYGGLAAVAWTSSLQCVLLLGGGLYVFVAGLAKINWDFAAVLYAETVEGGTAAVQHPEMEGCPVGA